MYVLISLSRTSLQTESQSGREEYLLVDLDDSFAFNVLDLGLLLALDQLVYSGAHFVPVNLQNLLFVSPPFAELSKSLLQLKQNPNGCRTLLLEALLDRVHDDALGQERLRSLCQCAFKDRGPCSQLEDCPVQHKLLPDASSCNPQLPVLLIRPITLPFKDLESRVWDLILFMPLAPSHRLSIEEFEEEAEDSPGGLTTLFFDPNLELFGFELHLDGAKGLRDVENTEKHLESFLFLRILLDKLSDLFLQLDPQLVAIGVGHLRLVVAEVELKFAHFLVNRFLLPKFRQHLFLFLHLLLGLLDHDLVF